MITEEKILVENFACPEVSTEHPEVLAEAVGIIEDMGLEGQKNFLPKSDSEPNGVRNPYRLMKKDEVLVYSTLCPEKQKLEDYDGSPIPFRVLEIIKHAKQFEFLLFEVWSMPAQQKDPVLVAYTEDGWDKKPYILARWGEVLDNFQKLTDKACEMLRAVAKSSVVKARVQLSNDEQRINDLTFDDFMQTRTAYYNGWS